MFILFVSVSILKGILTDRVYCYRLIIQEDTSFQNKLTIMQLETESVANKSAIMNHSLVALLKRVKLE